MLACWPNEWREDFAEQNRLLAEDGEEPLTLAEYLQCRADDLEEFRALHEREPLMRNLMGVVEDTAADGGAIVGAWRAVVDWETYSGEMK